VPTLAPAAPTLEPDAPALGVAAGCSGVVVAPGPPAGLLDSAVPPVLDCLSLPEHAMSASAHAVPTIHLAMQPVSLSAALSGKGCTIAKSVGAQHSGFGAETARSRDVSLTPHPPPSCEPRPPARACSTFLRERARSGAELVGMLRGAIAGLTQGPTLVNATSSLERYPRALRRRQSENLAGARAAVDVLRELANERGYLEIRCQSVFK
jgi:hypothetical protein